MIWREASFDATLNNPRGGAGLHLGCGASARVVVAKNGVLTGIGHKPRLKHPSLHQPPWSNMFRTLRNAACSTCNGHPLQHDGRLQEICKWKGDTHCPTKTGHDQLGAECCKWVLFASDCLIFYIHICTIPINSIQYSNPQKIEKCFQNVFDHVICTSHFQVSHLLFSI